LTGNRSSHLARETDAILQRLGVARHFYQDGPRVVRSPLTGEPIANVRDADAAEAEKVVDAAVGAFRTWRVVPAPRRGERVRLLGAELRAAKDELGRLVTIEAGKILTEGRGEVQEMIDICDFAVGLSRQLYGLTIASERPAHRMMEQWHPLGPIGVITTFNFPVAVWSWNAALALVCGDPVIWKPSEKTPLTALAVQALLDRAVHKFGDAPMGLSAVLIGDRATAAFLIDDPRLPLVSATGSTGMGRSVAPRLAQRFARAILELGGNNAAIVCPSADLELALRAIAFAAIGTAGQRCTTLRRLFVHQETYAALLKRLQQVYVMAPVGNPLDDDFHPGRTADRRSGICQHADDIGGAARSRRADHRRRAPPCRSIPCCLLCAAGVGGVDETDRTRAAGGRAS
jgi:aldehyde dehydrogenase (NAD+)